MFAETETYFQNNNGFESINDIQNKLWYKNRHPHVGGIELTPYCNLKCVHCYLQDQKKKRLMGTDEIKTIIDKLEMEGVLFLYFTGGEILTREDFDEIYVYAKKKGFIIELLTNGTLISEKLVNMFCDYPPADISISIYGKDEESYQRVTGQKGMFNRVIKAIELLRDNGIHFEMKYIGMKENEGDYECIKKMAEEYGAVFTYSLELFPTLLGNACTKRHMMGKTRIIEIEKQDDDKVKGYIAAYNMGNPYVDKQRPLYLCDMAITNFLIDYEGYINPCHKCRYKKWNILSCEFKDAWEDYAKLLKLKTTENSKCNNCPYLMLCSPCVIVNYLSTGDYNTPSDDVCELTKERVKYIEEWKKISLSNVCL